MERLFQNIAKINSVLLLLILIGAGISIAWVTWSSTQWQRRGAIEVPTGDATSKEKVLLNFERVQDIVGANTQMMLLSAEEKSGKISSGGYGSETRNVLFLSGVEKKARWLFSKQNNLILVAEQLQKETEGSKKEPTQALYFEYVTTDTNGDGKLSAQDQAIIGLSKPNGLGFVTILSNVTRVLSHEILDSQKLSVVYQSGTKVRHARFSILSMKLEADQEITNVPEGI